MDIYIHIISSEEEDPLVTLRLKLS